VITNIRGLLRHGVTRVRSCDPELVTVGYVGTFIGPHVPGQPLSDDHAIRVRLDQEDEEIIVEPLDWVIDQ
jgi:hypothetical protein